MPSIPTTFRSLDGLTLHGTLVTSATVTGPATVLVHGGGVTREEGGFFGRLADGLAEVGLPSLRFDFRGHGASDGRQEDLTLAGVVNDIRAAAEHVREVTNSQAVNLIGTSFGGGISAFPQLSPSIAPVAVTSVLPFVLKAIALTPMSSWRCRRPIRRWVATSHKLTLSALTRLDAVASVLPSAVKATGPSPAPGRKARPGRASAVSMLWRASGVGAKRHDAVASRADRKGSVSPMLSLCAASCREIASLR